MNEGRGDWIKTYSGIHFHPQDVRPEDIEIEDIAHALSHQCRYSGHLQQFYSVAQHCCEVAGIVEEHGGSRLEILAALLHDASEAYLVDVPSPIKPLLKGYYEIEDRVSKAITDKYLAPYPWPDIVKFADLTMLYTEARDLLIGGFQDWDKNDGPTSPRLVVPLSSALAKVRYLNTFSKLVEGRAL